MSASLLRSSVTALRSGRLCLLSSSQALTRRCHWPFGHALDAEIGVSRRVRRAGCVVLDTRTSCIKSPPAQPLPYVSGSRISLVVYLWRGASTFPTCSPGRAGRSSNSIEHGKSYVVCEYCHAGLPFCFLCQNGLLYTPHPIQSEIAIASSEQVIPPTHALPQN